MSSSGSGHYRKTNWNLVIYLVNFKCLEYFSIHQEKSFGEGVQNGWDKIKIKYWKYITNQFNEYYKKEKIWEMESECNKGNAHQTKMDGAEGGGVYKLVTRSILTTWNTE